MEDLTNSIVKAFYIPEECKVIYKSEDGKEEKVFDALEWLAAMCSHVPNKGKQYISMQFLIEPNSQSISLRLDCVPNESNSKLKGNSEGETNDKAD